MICQEQYAKEILRKVMYDTAHALENPMEVDMRLVGVKVNVKPHSRYYFHFCDAIEIPII